MIDKILSQNKEFKTCSLCNKKKNITSYGRHPETKDKLQSQCKDCRRISTRSYYKSEDGVITKIFWGQVYSSKRRNHVKPNYTKEEFKAWMYENGFYALWCQFSWSEYTKGFSPSPDRIDDYKPYTFDNLTLVIWNTNNKRAKLDAINGVNRKQSKPVNQINKITNEIINNFYSISEASRKTGLHIGNISACCSGRLKTTGGYKWEFS